MDDPAKDAARNSPMRNGLLDTSLRSPRYYEKEVANMGQRHESIFTKFLLFVAALGATALPMNRAAAASEDGDQMKLAMGCAAIQKVAGSTLASMEADLKSGKTAEEAFRNAISKTVRAEVDNAVGVAGGAIREKLGEGDKKDGRVKPSGDGANSGNGQAGNGLMAVASAVFKAAMQAKQVRPVLICAHWTELLYASGFPKSQDELKTKLESTKTQVASDIHNSFEDIARATSEALSKSKLFAKLSPETQDKLGEKVLDALQKHHDMWLDTNQEVAASMNFLFQQRIQQQQ